MGSVGDSGMTKVQTRAESATTDQTREVGFGKGRVRRTVQRKRARSMAGLG